MTHLGAFSGAKIQHNISPEQCAILSSLHLNIIFPPSDAMFPNLHQWNLHMLNMFVAYVAVPVSYFSNSTELLNIYRTNVPSKPQNSNIIDDWLSSDYSRVLGPKAGILLTFGPKNVGFEYEISKKWLKHWYCLALQCQCKVRDI